MRPAWRFVDWTARWGHVAVQFQWEPRDLWVGVFYRFERWRSKATGWDNKHGVFIDRPWSLHAYICFLPLVPLHVYVSRTIRPPARGGVSPSGKERP